MISALMDLLNTCYECGDFMQMETVAKIVQHAIPDEIVSMSFLGLAYLRTGRMHRALPLFQKLRKKKIAALASGNDDDAALALPDTHTAAAGCYLEATKLNPQLTKSWQAAAREIESFGQSHRHLLQADGPS